MMRNYKVPIGMTQEEMDKAKMYFDKKNNDNVKWYQIWKTKKKLDEMYFDNKHSDVIYLMSSDNKFL